MIILLENMTDKNDNRLPSITLDLDMNSIRSNANIAFVLYKAICQPIFPSTKSKNTRTIAERLIASNEVDARMVGEAIKSEADLIISENYLTVFDVNEGKTVFITDFVNANMPAGTTLRLGLDFAPLFFLTIDDHKYVINTKALSYSFFTLASEYLKRNEYDEKLHKHIVFLGETARKEILERENRQMPNIDSELKQLKEMKKNATQETSC